MYRFRHSLLLVCLTAGAVAGAPAAALARAAPRLPGHAPLHAPARLQPRVIGGTAATSGLGYVAFVSYHVPGSSWLSTCTGTVIAPTVILTAGHCVVDENTGQTEDPAWFSVTTGATDLNSPSAVSSDVSQVIPYPNYDPQTVDGDAGILVLSQPVGAPTLRLAAAGDSASEQAGTVAVMAGWGLTSGNATDTPSVLQWAQTVVQSNPFCSAANGGEFDPALDLCAQNIPANNTATCDGDSGGPLIALDAAGQPVQIGIVSNGADGCPTDAPDNYTRVSGISSWANGVIRSSGATPATPPPTLPTLTASAAGGYVQQALAGALHQTFTRRRGYRSACNRQSRTSFICGFSFASGPNDYYGTVHVYYVLSGGQAYWNDQYAIHWVSDACARSSHRRSCRVRTIQGS